MLTGPTNTKHLALPYNSMWHRIEAVLSCSVPWRGIQMDCWVE